MSSSWSKSSFAGNRRVVPVPMPAAVILFLSAVIVLALGCSKTTEPEPPRYVTITPWIYIASAGDTIQFSAAVEGLPPGVTWSLKPHDEYADSLGFITAGGLYFAPTLVIGEIPYRIRIEARSTADTSVSNYTLIEVPPIQVGIGPNLVSSVVPGSEISIAAGASYDRGAGVRLYVDGIEGGNESVGTLISTGSQSTVYAAPSTQQVTGEYTLSAVSIRDSTRSANATIQVRRGFPVEGNPGQSQWAPEWSPVANKLAYVEMPSAQLIVHDLSSGHKTAVATVSGRSNAYVGRISWSPDGSALAFEKEIAWNQHSVGMVSENGTELGELVPEPTESYRYPVFLPSRPGGTDNLLVVVRREASYELRAFAAPLRQPGGGRLLHASSFISWPDAVQIQGTTWVTAFTNGAVAGHHALVCFEDWGVPVTDFVVLDSYRRSGLSLCPLRAHWAAQGDVYWVNYYFHWSGIHRRHSTGYGDAVELYSGDFGAFGADVSPFAPENYVITQGAWGEDPHLWVVEYPAPEFPGVSRSPGNEARVTGNPALYGHPELIGLR